MGKPVYLYVTPFFPSPKSWRGGYCYDMASALRDTGAYDVVVMTSGSADYEYHGLSVKTFRHRALPCGVAPFLLARANARAFLARLRELGVDPASVAVCHAHVLEFAIYADALKQVNPRCRTLLHHHCINPIRLFSGRLGEIPVHATILYLFWRRLCARMDVHVFCSGKSRESYGKAYAGGIPERGFEDVRSHLLLGRFLPPLTMRASYVYYNGYNAKVFCPLPGGGDQTNRQQPTANNLFTIGCVANFGPYKDQLTLVRAFARVHARHPASRLRLVGSGELLPVCQAEVAKLNLAEAVSFETEVDHLALPDFYRAIDLFVLPSRDEGFCCAYIEAAGCGTPFMGCRGVSVEEALDSKVWDDWLVPPGDPVALAEKVENFLARHPRFRLGRPLDTDSVARAFVGYLKGGRP